MAFPEWFGFAFCGVIGIVGALTLWSFFEWGGPLDFITMSLLMGGVILSFIAIVEVISGNVTD